MCYEKDENDLVKIIDYEAECVRPRGRPKETWREFVEKSLLDLTADQRGCYGP